MRRLVDMLAAGVAAALLLPLLLATWLVVLMLLGRPALFVQTRSGWRGLPFRMVKFRSMTNSRGSDGELLPDRMRVTTLGRLLRRSRLDEAPSLWNVMKGEMSLIGPRPLLARTVAAMGEAGVRRGAVRPGLTGWAQVNGNALLGDAEKLALDLWYIRHRSLRLDLLILWKTLKVIVLGEHVDDAQLHRAEVYANGTHRSR
jgi:lipopolysaccharide/colanic/teichoic acid biosynthesis glycosyltransferase